MFRKRRKTFEGPGPRKQKKIFQWRLIDLGDSGMYCYFDPGSERIEIYPLTSREKTSMLKEYGSVSGLGRDGAQFQDAQLPLFGLELKDAKSA